MWERTSDVMWGGGEDEPGVGGDPAVEEEWLGVLQHVLLEYLAHRQPWLVFLAVFIPGNI